MKKFIVIASIVCSIFFVSCRDGNSYLPVLEHHTSPPPSEIGYVGSSVSIKITSSINGVRAFSMDNTDGNVPKINWKPLEGKSVKVHCALRKRGDVNNEYTTYFDIKGKVEKQGDTYKVLFDPVSFQLKKGEISKGSEDWYIQAVFTGEDETSVDYNSSTHHFYGMADMDKLNKGQAPDDIHIPVVCKWTKVQVNDNNRINVKVTFNPFGCFLKLPVDIEPTHLYQPLRPCLVLNTNILSTKGYIELGEVSDPNNLDNQSPKWQDIRTENPNDSQAQNEYGWRDINIKMLKDNGDLIQLSKDQTLNRSIYIWGVPVLSTGRIELQYQFNIAFSNTDEANLNKMANDNNLVSAYTSKKVTINISNTLHNAESYQIKADDLKVTLPKSDLMITEVYNSNWGPLLNESNYTIVELYNPTDKDIDLSNYFLVRERTMEPDGPHGTIMTGRFQPNDTNSSFGQALAQDIAFPERKPNVNPTDSKTEGNMLGRIPVVANAANANTVWGKANPFLNRLRFVYGEQNADNSLLSPGQCVLLLSGGFFSRSEPLEYFIKDYAKNAVDGLKCKYVVTVDNGTSVDQRQSRLNGGVLQLGPKQCLILGKWKDRNLWNNTDINSNFEVVDVTGPFTYGTSRIKQGENGPYTVVEEGSEKNLATQDQLNYYRSIIGANLNNSIREGGAQFSLVRKAWCQFPNIKWQNNKEEGVWSTKDSWLYVYGYQPACSKVNSFGSRYVESTFISDSYKKLQKKLVDSWDKGKDKILGVLTGN